MRTHACSHAHAMHIAYVSHAHFFLHATLRLASLDPDHVSRSENRSLDLDHVARIRMLGLLVRTGSTTELHATTFG